MSEVHRYYAVTMLSEEGNRIRYDPHGPLIVLASEFDRITAERDALQERLNVADQKADDLEFSDNDRELSRRSWFDEAKRLEEEVRLLKHDVASYLETMGRTCDLLGIDLDAAKNAEGKPSDVLFKHAQALNNKLAERDALLREASKAILRHQAEQPMSHRLAAMLTKARAKIDRYLKTAALSASAEPVATRDWCATMERPKSKCGCPDCGSSIVQICVPAERDERAELSAKNQQLSGLLQQSLAALNPRGALAIAIKTALERKPVVIGFDPGHPDGSYTAGAEGLKHE